MGKTLVVLDDPSLDLLSVEGRLIAHAKAIGPAKELERIKARIRDSHAERRYTPQWHGGTRKWGASPLLDVVFCGQCGSKATRNMTVKREKEYAYYVCKNRHPRQCPGARMRESDVMVIVEAEFLSQVGGERVHRKMFVPGQSHEIELQELKGKIQRLRQDREQGLFDGEDDEAEYRKLMTGYLARRRELERLPASSAGWRYEITDDTYAEARERGDDQKRRTLLMDAGVRFEVLSVREWTITIPEDMIGRLREARFDQIPMSGSERSLQMT